MKLLALNRILLGRNFMNKHHRQWVEGKVVEICLQRAVKSGFSNCKMILRCATKFGEDVYYCSITLLLLLSLQVGKSLLWSNNCDTF